MKKFIYSLLFIIAALVVTTTTTSCAHRNGHRTQRPHVYNAEDTAFVMDLASRMMCHEVNNIDDYMFYTELRARELEAETIVLKLSPKVREELAKICIKEYGFVDDIAVAELTTNKQLIDYITVTEKEETLDPTPITTEDTTIIENCRTENSRKEEKTNEKYRNPLHR